MNQLLSKKFLEPVAVDDVLELALNVVLDSDEGDLALAPDDDSADGLGSGYDNGTMIFAL